MVNLQAVPTGGIFSDNRNTGKQNGIKAENTSETCVAVILMELQKCRTTEKQKVANDAALLLGYSVCIEQQKYRLAELQGVGAERKPHWLALKSYFEGGEALVDAKSVRGVNCRSHKQWSNPPAGRTR
jgi:hypothetical protein